MRMDTQRRLHTNYEVLDTKVRRGLKNQLVLLLQGLNSLALSAGCSDFTPRDGQFATFAPRSYLFPRLRAASWDWWLSFPQVEHSYSLLVLNETQILTFPSEHFTICL